MKLPEDIQEKLEEFWAEEYESDYQHLFEKEQTKAPSPLQSEEMVIAQYLGVEILNPKS